MQSRESALLNTDRQSNSIKFWTRNITLKYNHLTLSYTGFFGLAGHGEGGDGIHRTFITLVLFDGFELNVVQ